MRFLYSISIRLFIIGIAIASLFNVKAKLWRKGRIGWKKKLDDWRSGNPGDLIWIHCASLGEFEQGRPVIEALKKENPDRLILLTFFSPSGYEIRKNYPIADHVCYLPADTPSNAISFLSVVKPSLIVFVKYEYWANFFLESKNRNVPLLMVSAILRSDQRFFGMFRKFWGQVLSCVTHFYVQDPETERLLAANGFRNVTIAGDTRFDRVAALVKGASVIERMQKFCAGRFTVIGGSTWETEDAMLQSWVRHAKEHYPILIIAPHELDMAHRNALRAKFPDALWWSEWERNTQSVANVLIIDTIGMLSSIYRYADVAVIGGGFGKGIHNTLEAAAWDVPVIFGPEYKKFREAEGLLESGGGFTFSTEAEFFEKMDKVCADIEYRRKSGVNAGDFVRRNTGATGMIMSGIRPLLKG